MNKKAHEIDQLILENRGFVYDMARNYASSGVPFNDLVNAGMLGLAIAAQKYETDRNVKFISFATCWVQHEMIKVIRETRFPCRVPLNLNKVINRARRGEYEDSDPALAEVLSLLKTPESRSFRDSSITTFDDEVVNRVSIAQALEDLSPRSREMVKMFFGIGCECEQSIPTISARFNLSRQRVRNIIKQSLLQIKSILQEA